MNFVKELADTKNYPRAECVLAVVNLNGQEMPKNKETTMKYLDRSSEHASYDIQKKIAYFYHMLGEQKNVKCFELAIYYPSQFICDYITRYSNLNFLG